MDQLYAPWRHKYVSSTAHKNKKAKSKRKCPFCAQFAENKDSKFFILKRYKNTAVVMNLYPYNAGHLLILPLKHKKDLASLGKEVRIELMELINIAVQVLEKVMHPDGFNVGLNLGNAGGGGIPGHLHFHVLPRWSGDTNFLATLSNTKVICSDFRKLYKELKSSFPSEIDKFEDD